MRGGASIYRNMLRKLLSLLLLVTGLAALGQPARANRVIVRLRGAPRMADALVAVAGDLRPAGALLSPGALFSFLDPRSARPTPESA